MSSSRTVSTTVVTRDWGAEDVGKYCVAGSKFLLGMLKKILKIVVKVVQGYKRT